MILIFLLHSTIKFQVLIFMPFGRPLRMLESAVGKPQFDVVWRMIPSCHMWCFWKERTNIRFDDRERTLVELKGLYFKTLTIGLLPSTLIFLSFIFF